MNTTVGAYFRALFLQPKHMLEKKHGNVPFQADAKQVLRLVTHSIYSDRSIFLRELSATQAMRWTSHESSHSKEKISLVQKNQKSRSHSVKKTKPSPSPIWRYWDE